MLTVGKQGIAILDYMKVIGWIMIISSIFLILSKGKIYTSFEGITNMLIPIIIGIICIYTGSKKKKENIESQRENKSYQLQDKEITHENIHKSSIIDGNSLESLFNDNTKNMTIKFLYDLAAIDKELCLEERKFIYHIMDKYNISSNQLKHSDNQEEIICNIQHVSRLSKDDKVLFAVYMYLLIIIDGDANQEEKKFFNRIMQNINISVSFDEFECTVKC